MEVDEQSGSASVDITEQKVGQQSADELYE